MRVGFFQKGGSKISLEPLKEGLEKELSVIPEDEMKEARKWQ